MCIQGLSRIELGINLPAGCFVQFLFLQQESYPSIYYFTFLVTPDHQKLWVINSTIFYCPPCPFTSVLQYSLMISVLSLSSLDIYTFPSLYMMPSTSCHSSSLSIFTSAHFISSTAFTTLLSFILDCFTFSSRSTPSMITSTPLVLCTSSHSSLTNILFLLSLSTLTSQSSLLLRLSVFPILLPGIYFSIKSNLDRYRAHFVVTQPEMTQTPSQSELTKRT